MLEELLWGLAEDRVDLVFLTGELWLVSWNCCQIALRMCMYKQAEYPGLSKFAIVSL